METIGIAQLAADARKLNNDEILATIQSAFADRLYIAHKLEPAMPAIRTAVHHLLDPQSSFDKAIASPLQQTTTVCP
jgi:hypothetical protein